MKPFAHYKQKLRDRGVGGLIADRLRWYKQSFQIQNLVGRYIELTGNVVDLDGVTLSVKNPLIGTRHKSAIYFGLHEVGERELIKRIIDRELPTIEIGASIGGVACTTNKLLRDPKAHVVLECNPMLLPTLEKNRALNGSEFSIEPYALAYGSDTISFSVCTDNFMMGRLYGEGRQITVPTITLRQIFDKYNFDTVNLISDSEGAEVEMVENEANLLRDRVNCLVLETHAIERGNAAIEKMLSRLHSLGFEIALKDTNKPVFALTNRRHRA